MQEYSTPNIWNRSLTVVVFVLCFLLVWGVLHIYEDQKKIDVYTAERELQLTNKIQLNNILLWRQQRLIDSTEISEDELFGLTVARFFSNKSPNIKQSIFKEYIVSKLRLLQEYKGYDAVYLVDSNGNLIMNNLGLTQGVMPPEEIQALQLAKEMASPQTINPRKESSFDFPYFSVVTPIYKNDETIAALWMVTDVRKHLYPILENWPVFSQSGESLLISQKDGEIKILNSLKYIDKENYVIEVPFDNADSPVILTINGMRGLFDGVDYRGENVIAVSSQVQGSDWFLITKSDKAEAMSSDIKKLLYLMLPILLAIFVSGASIIILQWRGIKKQNELQIALEKQVYLDPLTGIANRRGFNGHSREIIEQTVKPDFQVSLLMIDIDNFKKYNDYYGHLDGDKCLITIAKIIGQNIDVQDSMVARLGGEEFAVFLPDISTDQAQDIANTLRLKVNESAIHHQGVSEHAIVTISVGIANLNRHQFGVMSASSLTSKLLSQADKALYQAKNTGKDRVCIY